MTEPKLGDLVHFRRVCSACRKAGGRKHFGFFIDDEDMLAVLPPFGAPPLHTNAEGRRVSWWWDHAPSRAELFKMKLWALWESMKSLVGIRDTHGYEDTRLIMIGGDNAFFAGPSRTIVPLSVDEVLGMV